MALSLRNKFAISLLSLAVVIYRTQLLESYFGWSNSTTQFVLTPLVLLTVFLFSFWHEVMPRLAITFAAVASIILGIASFGVVSEKHDSVKLYFSPFISDPHESESIKFSDLLQKMFSSFDVDLQIERVSNPLLNKKAVRDFLENKLVENEKEAVIVLSGSARWLSMSISPKFSEHLVLNTLDNLTSHFHINLVTEVSGIGLSDAFSSASREYITHMVAAFSSINDGNFELAENQLLDAASIVGKWTAPTHRAYSLWLLGTVYLNKAFEDNSFELAYLKCSIDYFNRARGFIRNKEDPELLAAILNNRASAHFLSYVFHGKKQFRKQALKEFKVASRLQFKNGNLISRPSWLVARENLYYLNRPKEHKDLKAQYMRKVQRTKAKGKKSNVKNVPMS